MAKPSPFCKKGDEDGEDDRGKEEEKKDDGDDGETTSGRGSGRWG